MLPSILPLFPLLATTASAAEPTPFDTMLRALSSRDPVACETLEGLSPTPAATMLEVVDKVSMPPWAPMIAANCLLLHHPTDVKDRLDRWVTDPELAGFGRLTIDAFDQLPLEIAVPVARKALTGAESAHAKKRLAASAKPELKVLAVGP